MKPIIQIEHLSKKYLIKHQTGGVHYKTLRESIASLPKRLFSRAPKEKSEEFWALDDVSFDIMPGECVGIIGRNGAGKSTLLKLLSRITEPTKGKITLRGRVASLLEVGTGFHPELTGRENIFLNGAILGMRRSEIQRKFDEIVDFSGVEKFLDTPVKRYSSGMYVRLAFAVAAHLEPEILIVDEVLAVGDAEFQKKCLGKMEEVSQGQGRTVLFVSHNMIAVQQLCERGILLENGKIKVTGSINSLLRTYVKQEERALIDRTDRKGNGYLQLSDIAITRSDLQSTPCAGEDLYIQLRYNEIDFAKHNIRVDIRIDTIWGEHIVWLSNMLLGTPIKNSNFYYKIPRCPINIGTYTLTICTRVDNEITDWIMGVTTFTVSHGSFYASHSLPPQEQTSRLVDFDVIFPN